MICVRAYLHCHLLESLTNNCSVNKTCKTRIEWATTFDFTIRGRGGRRKIKTGESELDLRSRRVLLLACTCMSCNRGR